jgi:hypothetical protein
MVSTAGSPFSIRRDFHQSRHQRIDTFRNPVAAFMVRSAQPRYSDPVFFVFADFRPCVLNQEVEIRRS